MLERIYTTFVLLMLTIPCILFINWMRRVSKTDLHKKIEHHDLMIKSGSRDPKAYMNMLDQTHKNQRLVFTFIVVLILLLLLRH